MVINLFLFLYQFLSNFNPLLSFYLHFNIYIQDMNAACIFSIMVFLSDCYLDFKRI